MEPLLATELGRLGALRVETARSGVSFEGEMEFAYRACLWSRLASRVLLPLHDFPVRTPEELYSGISAVDWMQHLSVDDTLAVDSNTVESDIDHTHFVSQKVKDAIVDQMRTMTGKRPSVDLKRPNLRINLYLFKNQATVSIDMAGDGLHRRGYRKAGGLAPLKENLAAAILLRADWPQIAEEGGELIDPMCGSGTLCIEAAMMAADIAPGLERNYFGFMGWRGFDPAIWRVLIDEARKRRLEGLASMPLILGFDVDPNAIRIAKKNVDCAALRAKVQIEQRELTAVRPLKSAGLVVVNPPYGERLGEQRKLEQLYARLGISLKKYFVGWQAAMFTGNPKLAGELRLRPRRSYSFYNGPIKCRLLCFNIAATTTHPKDKDTQVDVDRRQTTESEDGKITFSHSSSSGPTMLANRLRKNLRNIGRWASREGLTCYRLYDADLPEYAFAVDLYRGALLWVHVQEYEAPASIDPGSVERRRTEGLQAIADVLQVAPSQFFFKIRRPQKGSSQYEKQDAAADFVEIAEGGCRYLINLSDYLDTGFFLDQRLTRKLIQERVRNGRFLNLFGYTGAASVSAAVGGAVLTTTVDMSTTYLDWARRNFELNDIGGTTHQLVKADCLVWLDQYSGQRDGCYDLIWLDPPTFSNSKRMPREFDVQRDHVALIDKTARLLAPNGVLLFSTSYRRFKLNDTGLKSLRFKDISAATLPKDFARRKRMHNCWEIRCDQDS